MILRMISTVDSGERVSDTWVICLRVGDTPEKLGLIPNMVSFRMKVNPKAGVSLSLRDEPTSYQLVGKVTAYQGLRVAGLRGWSATLGLRHCPDSYGRLQSRILDNARKRDPATPRGG